MRGGEEGGGEGGGREMKWKWVVDREQGGGGREMQGEKGRREKEEER